MQEAKHIFWNYNGQVRKKQITEYGDIKKINEIAVLVSSNLLKRTPSVKTNKDIVLSIHFILV